VIVVVDAIVARKWFLQSNPPEPHTELALRLLERSVLGLLPMVNPSHFVSEVAAVLARLKPADARYDLIDLLEISHSTATSPEIYATAMDLALRRRHHWFDTLYHAVALHTQGAVLVTADARYHNKVDREGQIMLLSDFAWY
jgi:predicted nucleic acid-binding protein